jgi:hypothetical protein
VERVAPGKHRYASIPIARQVPSCRCPTAVPQPGASVLMTFAQHTPWVVTRCRSASPGPSFHWTSVWCSSKIERIGLGGGREIELDQGSASLVPTHGLAPGASRPVA